MNFEKDYGFQACYDSVSYAINVRKENPIYLLGKYMLRAEQDPLFNTTMVDAIKTFIDVNNIKWNYSL